MLPSYLEVEKTGSQLFRACQTLLQLFGESEKWIPAIWRLKNVVHNCQEQGKRLLHLFKVRKTGSQQLGAGKKCLPAIWKWKKVVPSNFEPDKHCCSYLEREKSGSLLFGDQKMQFTTVRSKKKDYYISLNLKNWFTAIRSSKKMLASYLEVEKTGSQLFHA